MRILALLLAFVSVACSDRGGGTSPPTRSHRTRPTRTLDESLAAGTAFLVKQQSEDGAWRSDVYGTFKDGRALTPLAVVALQAADSAPEARRRGAVRLAKMVRADGTIDEGEDGLDYPVYTAALSVLALSHAENREFLPARDAWVTFLLERQLTEKLGWNPNDKAYGGWGYCRTIPRKPAPNRLAPPLIESNLSATLFALEALRTAGLAHADAYKAAAVFVRRCQNEDGGFHFIYDDPVRNKAGGNTNLSGQFHSYGSSSADGLRALKLCHADPEAVNKAHHWLTTHFRADSHPGEYIPSHERNRNAVYFYYAASVAKALQISDAKEPDGKPWAPALAAALIRRQQSEGHWANPIELVRENDPVVATCGAIMALAECRGKGR